MIKGYDIPLGQFLMTICHMPLYKKFREIVNEGRIGPLKMVQIPFGTRKPYDVTKRFLIKNWLAAHS
ncbi:hypothetical protein [Bacillus tequilensis]|uniref:Uncharacterized protein n=1 Tax=Bacillus tequilensis TaxID=227866 RepID=A0A6H0WPB0_9BACI|nr:hypothetical protein [Bacillus tequilensis]QIW81954.1 hypothetical protein G4P54_20270 [Bacillus tequilensis]